MSKPYSVPLVRLVTTWLRAEPSPGILVHADHTPAERYEYSQWLMPESAAVVQFSVTWPSPSVTVSVGVAGRMVTLNVREAVALALSVTVTVYSLIGLEVSGVPLRTREVALNVMPDGAVRL